MRCVEAAGFGSMRRLLGPMRLRGPMGLLGVALLGVALAACGGGDDDGGFDAGRPAPPPPEQSAQAVMLSRAGRLLTNIDIGEWEFDVPRGGELTVEVVAVEGVFDPFLRLISAEGRRLREETDSGPGQGARVERFFSETGGVYTVEVHAEPDGRFGVYTLELTVDPAPLVRARVLVTPETLVAGGEILFLDTSTGGPTSWAWDLGDGSRGDRSLETHRYEEPGRYTVRLEACSAISCDVWTVQLIIVAEADGGRIALDQTVLGAIDWPGDEDVWRFEGEAGQVVTVVVSERGFPRVDPTIELVGPDGASLAEADSYEESLQPRLIGVGLPASGEYTLRIRGSRAMTTGVYAIDLALTAPS